tara:strand:+ start:163 stop:1164 length:1002 start_codon:yes stop_codon:yes gene_type:complete
MEKIRISVIGSTSWGITLSNVLSNNVNQVILLSRSNEENKTLNINRSIIRQQNYEINKNVLISNDLKKYITDSNIILLAVPSISIEENINKISKYINNEHIIISAVKGFEYNSRKTISRYILDTLKIPKENIGVISGPNISSEIYENKPASSVIGIDKIHEKKIRNIFNTRNFRTYSSNDVIGIELGGILKNIYAIGAGIISEYNLGTNAMASYITRAIYEITKLSDFFGGENKTFYGNSGLGDLITTCFNQNSRNHKLGSFLAKGLSIEKASKKINGVIEGIQTTKIVKEILDNKIKEFPITNEIYKVLFLNKEPMSGINDLMSRENTTEQN